MLPRLCNLPKSLSFFLLGPRQTGKTTLIDSFIADKKAFKVNLLDRNVFLRYLTDPGLFYAETSKEITQNSVSYVFIDEIQKIPTLLDEVQRLIQETGVIFILSGSSARKLKRSDANLLGGRAVERHIFPLTYKELGSSFSLDAVLKYGSLPNIILNPSDEEKIDLLSSYVSTYLAEEIQQESIVRNLPGFVSFLEVAAQQSGELMNFSHVGRDANLQPRTVQTYYDILVDTLIGTRLPAYNKSIRRQVRQTPKFYLFDIGVLNALERQLRSTPDVNRFGRLFEHLIVLETHRLVKYFSSDGRIFFWRTKDGQEVDLLIESRGQLVAAIEIKSSTKVSMEYLSGLSAFHEEHPKVPRYVVARVPKVYDLNGIQVLPWESYLNIVTELL